MSVAVGRFAPSPTGPLHFGSLLAALASYLDVRTRGGRWLVRIDDIDPPREVPGAASDILATLAHYGFEWDVVLYQSERTQAYQQAIEALIESGQVFGCRCTRRQIAALAEIGPDGPRYPGTCRGRAPVPGEALRVSTDAGELFFDDRVRGEQRIDLAATIGDFAVRRRDGLFSYHLACAVDDADGISEVVRGADLLRATAPQIRLQQLLGLPSPVYAHLPVATHTGGRKLSKQTFAPPLVREHALIELQRAWHCLGQAAFTAPPETLDEFWQLALSDWQIERVPAGDFEVQTG